MKNIARKIFIHSFIVVFAFILFFPLPSKAAQDIRFWVNGSFVKNDVSPIIENSRVLVPVRFVAENLGYKVNWEPDERKVVVYLPEFYATGNGLFLYIDSRVVGQNEDPSDDVIIDVPPRIINNRTYLPLRSVAELLDTKVGWDSTNRVVIIGNGYKSTKG